VDIQNMMGSLLGKMAGLFIVMTMMTALIYSVGSIAPFFETGNRTTIETYEVDHPMGWLDSAIGNENLLEFSNGYAGIFDGATHGEAVTEHSTSEVAEFVDITGTGNETTPGYAYVSFNEFSENVTAVSVVVENPDQGDSVAYDFNVSELRTHVSENGDERYYIPFWAEDVSFMADDTDGTFEMKISLDRSNSNGTSEDSLELGDWGVGFEKETVEEGSSYPGSRILESLGFMVLAFGSLIGLLVVLFTSVVGD